jgi:hypothetical protein
MAYNVMLLPFCYSLPRNGNLRSPRSPYELLADMLMLCLQGTTRERLARRAGFDVDRYIAVLLCYGLLAEAGGWLVITGKGKLFITHYDVVRRMLD